MTILEKAFEELTEKLQEKRLVLGIIGSGVASMERAYYSEIMIYPLGGIVEGDAQSISGPATNYDFGSGAPGDDLLVVLSKGENLYFLE